ncbi:MAG: hypothetical protein J6U23_11610 [Clostridiales bacterium]|nr:hypothetical protein [Clostridiales bacterium]
MRKMIMWIVTVPLLLSAIFGLTGCRPDKDEWYKDAVEYYRQGVLYGKEGNNRQLDISPEILGKGKGVGYLLHDLDGDGRDELLIGFNSAGGITKFTNVVVRHSDLGPYSLLGGSNGYYIYLCNDDVLRVDSWYGSETKVEYMKFNSKSNSFEVVNGAGKYSPKQWKLTQF